MALITCTECGKQFSEKAKACPNCGCPTTEVLKEIKKREERYSKWNSRVKTLDQLNNQKEIDEENLKDEHVESSYYKENNDQDEHSTVNFVLIDDEEQKGVPPKFTPKNEKILSDEKIDEIKNEFENILSDAGETFEKSKEVLKKETENLGKNLNNLKDGVKDKYNKTKEVAQEKLNESKEKASAMNKKDFKIPKPALIGIGIFAFVACSAIIFVVGTSKKESPIVQEETTPVVAEKTFDWDDLILKKELRKVQTNKGEIETNTSEYLCLEVKDYSEEQYEKYIESCISKGYVNLPLEETYEYKAYSDEGYFLQLEYDKDDKEMDIELKAPLETIEKNFAELVLASKLPDLGTVLIHEEINDDEQLEVYISKVNEEAFNNYIDMFEQFGYNIDMIKEEKKFEAKNNEDYELKVEAEDYQMMKISLKAQIYEVTLDLKCKENSQKSKYDLDVYIDDESEGILYHGGSDTLSLNLKRGEHTFRVERHDETENNPTGMITFDVTSDRKFKIVSKCYKDRVDLVTVEGKNPPITNEDLSNLKYYDVVQAYQNAGFTNIKTVELYDLSADELSSKLDTIRDIEINGKKTFTKDVEVYSDTKIKIYYYAGANLTVPLGGGFFKDELYCKNVNEVVAAYQNAGFTNVTTEVDTNLNELSGNEMVSKVVDSKGNSVWRGNVYPSNEKLTVKYYSVQYNPYTADQMIADFESNIINAQSFYEGQYVQITGKVRDIDESGHFKIEPMYSNSWKYINCKLITDAQKDSVRNISKGGIVTVRGYITDVNDWDYYTLKVHYIN